MFNTTDSSPRDEVIERTKKVADVLETAKKNWKKLTQHEARELKSRIKSIAFDSMGYNCPGDVERLIRANDKPTPGDVLPLVMKNKKKATSAYDLLMDKVMAGNRSKMPGYKYQHIKFGAIEFAKPGVMHAKYVPESPFVSTKEGRKLAEAAVAKKKSQRKPQRDITEAQQEALNKLAVKHTRQREDLKAKFGSPKKVQKGSALHQSLQSMAKRHADERNAITPPKGYILTKPEPDYRAMMKADIATNLGGEHTGFHKNLKSINEAYTAQRAATNDDAALEKLDAQHKSLVGKIKKDYYHQVSNQKGYTTHQKVTVRPNVRKVMANELTEKRQVLQGMRKYQGLKPLPKETMERIKTEAKNMPQIGENIRGVKTGIASHHGKDKPFVLIGGGESPEDLPKRLDESNKIVKESVAKEVAGINKKKENLYDKLTKRARKNILASRSRVPSAQGIQGVNVKREIADQVRQTVHNVIQPTPPSGKVLEKTAKNLGYTPNQVNKISTAQRGIGLKGIDPTSYAGENILRKKILNAGKIFAPPNIAESKYPHLKSLGKGAAIAAGAGALATGGALIAKRIKRKRDEEKQFSSLISFGRNDPIPRLRLDFKGRLQGYGKEKDPGEVFNQQGHLHRAKLAARRRDLPVYKEAAINAGILRSDVKDSEALGHMGAMRSLLSEEQKLGRHYGKAPKWDYFQRGLKMGRNESVNRAYKAGQKMGGQIASIKIAENQKLSAENLKNSIAKSKGRGKRNTIIGTLAGLSIGAGGALLANRKRKQEMSSGLKTIQFGSIQNVMKKVKSDSFKRRLAEAAALTGGIGIADSVVSGVHPDPGTTRTQSSYAGLKRGLLYGGVLAGAEPVIRKPVKKLLNKFSGKHKLIRFQLDIDEELPKKKMTVAQDRYRKKIHEQERQRMESNLTRSALAGAGVSGLLKNRTRLSTRGALLAGAGAGIAAEGSLILRNRKSKDQYGERTYGAKRIEKLPYQAGAAIGGGILAKRLYKKFHFEEGKKTPEDKAKDFFSGRKWQPEALPRRGEEIYKRGQRAKDLYRDVQAQREGKEIVDKRGRKKTPEWEKPYFKKALGVGAIVTVLGGARLLTKNSKAVKVITKKAGNLVSKVPGVTKTKEYVKGVYGDSKKFIKSIDEGAAEKISKAAEAQKTKEAEAAKETVRSKLYKAKEHGNLLSSKRKPIYFATTVPDWDIRDQRGKSARIYAPGSQKRERRPKKWYEKKDNQRKIWEAAVGTGVVGGAGGLGLYQKFKNRPKTSPEPFRVVRAGEESLIHFPKSNDKFLWMRNLKPHKPIV